MPLQVQTAFVNCRNRSTFIYRFQLVHNIDVLPSIAIRRPCRFSTFSTYRGFSACTPENVEGRWLTSSVREILCFPICMTSSLGSRHVCLSSAPALTFIATERYVIMTSSWSSWWRMLVQSQSADWPLITQSVSHSVTGCWSDASSCMQLLRWLMLVAWLPVAHNTHQSV